MRVNFRKLTATLPGKCLYQNSRVTKNYAESVYLSFTSACFCLLLCWSLTHIQTLEDVTLHTSHRCTKFPCFSSSCVCWQVWDIMPSIIPRESWITNALRHIQTSADKDADGKAALSQRSQCGITMQYVQQLSTAVWGSGHLECSGLSIPCKLGQRHWNSSLCLAPPFSLSLCQFVSQPLLNSNTSSSTNNYTRTVSIKHICFTPECYQAGKQS